jgi:signal transduction histidine kinase
MQSFRKSGVSKMNVLSFSVSAEAATREIFDTEFHRLSHDLRNPLNWISGFAELLLMDEGLGAANADYVRAILLGSEELKAAVVSYLDRAEANTPQLTATPSRKAFSKLQHGRKRPAHRCPARPSRNFRSFERS